MLAAAGSADYTTISDRIASAYTPTAAGLHKQRAARLAAALGHNGAKPGKSSRELQKRASSQKLFNATETTRSWEVKNKALTGLSPGGSNQFDNWDPMVRSRSSPQGPPQAPSPLDNPFKQSNEGSGASPMAGAPSSAPRRSSQAFAPSRVAEIRVKGVDSAAGAGATRPVPSLPTERLGGIQWRAPCPPGLNAMGAGILNEVAELYLNAAATGSATYEARALEAGIPGQADKQALARAGAGQSDEFTVGGAEGGRQQGSFSGSFDAPEVWTNQEYQLAEWRVCRQTGVEHGAVQSAEKELRAIGHGVATSYPQALEQLWADERRKRSKEELAGGVFGENGGNGLVDEDDEDDEEEGNGGEGDHEVDHSAAALGGMGRSKSRVIRVEPPPPVPGDVVSLRLLPIDDPVFRAALPMPVEEFTRSLRRGLRASLSLLEKHWLPAATELVHAHVEQFPKGELLTGRCAKRLRPAPPSLASAKALAAPSSVRFDLPLPPMGPAPKPTAVEGGSAIMARQLRGSTSVALTALVDFFDRFQDPTVAGKAAKDDQAEGEGEEEDAAPGRAPDTALLVEMHTNSEDEAKDGSVVRVMPTLEMLQDELTSCMVYVIERAQDFPCIEPAPGTESYASALADYEGKLASHENKMRIMAAANEEDGDMVEYEETKSPAAAAPPRSVSRFDRRDTILPGAIESSGPSAAAGEAPFSPNSPSAVRSFNGQQPPKAPRFDVLQPGAMTSEDEEAQAAMAAVRKALEIHFAKPAALVAAFEPFRDLLNGERRAAVESDIAKRGRGEDTDAGLRALEEVLQELEETKRAVDAVGTRENAEGLGAVRAMAKEAAAVAARQAAEAAGEEGSTGGGEDAEAEVDDSLVNVLSERLVHYPLFTVNLEPAKAELHRRIGELRELVTTAAVSDQREEMAEQTARYEAIAQRLALEPINSEELRDLAKYHAECPGLQDGLMDEYLAQVVERHKFLLTSAQYVYPRRDVAAAAELWCWPARADANLTTSLEMYQRRKEDLLTLAKGEQQRLDELVESMQAKLVKLAEIHSLAPTEVGRAYKLAEVVGSSFDEADHICDVVQTEEQLLGLPETDNRSILKDLAEDLEPLRKLWTAAKQHVQNGVAWLKTPLGEVNPEQAERDAGELLAQSLKISKSLVKQGPARAASARVANQMLTEVKELLDSTIPLMQLVCTQGLQDRHWEAMETTTGLQLPHNKSTTVQDMLECGLHNYTAQIEDTCVSAQKEAALVKVLDKMESDWDGMVFGTKDWRSGQILAGIDEIQQALDDQIVKTQAMKGSRFVKPYLARVESWEHDLVTMQEILDNSLKVQSTWLYLEPIFSSDDIMRQMPEEGKLFRQVDAVWRASMDETKAHGDCLTVARRPGLLHEMVSANSKLDVISKGLNDYLRTKMLAFPRFFFLSNDELLEILAETKDPTKVQVHLKKCFEGMAALQFEKNLDITCCFDAMKEKIPFEYEEVGHITAQGKTIINPKDSGGNVEQWLVEVEVMMRKSLANIIDKAMVDYAAEPRLSWICKWQGQVVLAGNQTMWTAQVEKAIDGGGQLQALADLLQTALLETVVLVRGDLNKAQRTSIGALIVLDVHNRDATKELAVLGIERTTDFDWQSQMRYYWIEGRESAISGLPASLQCRMINANVLYAYEYLGNNGRLVITPLTDRCYRTLLGAIQLNLGGAPEGPAGTGKTETTKDLAKAIAIQCVVFNCSDSLDYKSMGKFLMGLASSGAWACFDEFNRITLEVLSVVAQQVLCIQRAKALNKSRFLFEGTELGLKTTCCPFITMNPGYAG